MDYKDPITVLGYLIYLYDTINQYEVHVRFCADKMKTPKKEDINSIIDYLEAEGFVKPPKKISLCVMRFRGESDEPIVEEW